MLPSVLARSRTQRSCVGNASRKVIELCRKKQKDNDKGKSKGSERGESKGKNNKEEFSGKCCKCGKIGHVSKDFGFKEKSAFEAGDELAETGCFEKANIALNALGDRISAVARRRSQNSYLDRFLCCSDCVPEECCGRLPDAPHARQSEE